LEDLNRVSDAQRQTLAEALRGMRAPVRIVSAFPLSDSRRQALVSALQKLLAAKVDCEFGQDPALLAGVSIHIGAQRLQANLKEELRFFGAAVRHEQ
jgi:F0F1-type ATP synthase delta subunit